MAWVTLKHLTAKDKNYYGFIPTTIEVRPKLHCKERQISKEGLNEFNLRYKNKVVTLQQIIDDGAFGGIETSLKRNGTILTDWNIYQDQKTSECETIGVLMLDILPWLKEQPTTIQRNISAILFNTWENRLNKDNILKIYVHNKKDVCTVDSKEYFKFLNLLKGR